MEKFDYSKEHNAARQSIDRILASTDTPEKKYIDLLQLAFYSAHQICLCAADGRMLMIRNLLAFSFAKTAMHTPIFWCVRFDGWPETPGITFNIFARQSARELAGAFTAAVSGRLFAAEPKDLLYNMEEQEDITHSEFVDWLARAFSNLRDALDLDNSVIFNRDAESLAYKLASEAKVYFADAILDEPNNLIALTEQQRKVLRYLADDPHIKQFQEDIVSGTDISRPTVGKILNSLQSEGFVLKDKKGVSITPQGLKHLGK